MVYIVWNWNPNGGIFNWILYIFSSAIFVIFKIVCMTIEAMGCKFKYVVPSSPGVQQQTRKKNNIKKITFYHIKYRFCSRNYLMTKYNGETLVSLGSNTHTQLHHIFHIGIGIVAACGFHHIKAPFLFFSSAFFFIQHDPYKYMCTVIWWAHTRFLCLECLLGKFIAIFTVTIDTS